MKHDFFIKERFLPLIESGEKKLEIRIRFKCFKKIMVGDKVVFNGVVTKTVKAIRRYPTFANMGRGEKPEHILPGATMGQIIGALREIYSPEKEKRGVLVFEFSP